MVGGWGDSGKRTGTMRVVPVVMTVGAQVGTMRNEFPDIVLDVFVDGWWCTMDFDSAMSMAFYTPETCNRIYGTY